MMQNFHVPDYLILPFGRAVKSDLQKIMLSAVSADGLYFSTNVPVIFIQKSDRKPLSLPEFPNHFQKFPKECFENDAATLDFIRTTLKSHNPNMTKYEELFLDLYFGTLTELMLQAKRDYNGYADAFKRIGIDFWLIDDDYKSLNDLWRALLPIPELQLYVQDPLAEEVSFQTDNNFRVDYGFWDGQKLIAVEIDGAEPEGYARDIRRDRLLRRAGVDVIHTTNWELQKHKALALVRLLPPQLFGHG
jgi:hypothetical protein